MKQQNTGNNQLLSVKDIEKKFTEMSLHSSVLKVFPTIISALSEQLDADRLYNALHDISYLQEMALERLETQINTLETMFTLLNKRG